MRLSVFFLLVLAAQAWATTTYSQQTRLSLNMKGSKVIDVLNEIEDKSEFYFLFNQRLVDVERKVDIEVKQENIEAILSRLFDHTNVSYLVIDRQIVLTTAQTDAVAVQQHKTVTGKVTDQRGLPLPGVTVVVKGTTTGTVTNPDGNFSLAIPQNAEVLQFSFVGMRSQEIAIEGRTAITIVMEEETIGIEEVIAVGYGTQKKSDITGTVASMPQERLEMVPNLNIAQAIQGSIPGVMVQTTTAGARPNEVIMIRGRNSILADNTPLIVIDGIPYGGQLNDVNPNDVQAIEVLKDASAAAIYGSRGANGVILITTKEGKSGKAQISADAKFSFQKFSNLPEIMTGEQFYQTKMERSPDSMTPSEKAVYESGEWVDWLDLASRSGYSQQYNVSASGGFNKTTYYLSGNLLDVKGLIINDDYKRLAGTINIDTDISNWLTIGTRTNISFSDMSGVSPSMSSLFWTNPLAKAFDEDRNLTISPVTDDPVELNPPPRIAD